MGFQAWVQGAVGGGPPILAQPGEEAAEEQLSWQEALLASLGRHHALSSSPTALHTPTVFGFCFYLVADSES